MWVLALNAGSLGHGEFTVTATRKNLIRLMFEIYEKYGFFPDVVAIQESMSNDFNLAPRFEKPECISDNTRIGVHLNGEFVDKSRGVVTYCDSNADLVNSLKNMDSKSEIVVSVHEYETMNRGKKMAKLVLFNCYRNTHESAISASLQDMIKIIEKKMKAARLVGLRNYLVVGDFNDEEFEIEELSEIIHPLLLHKHNQYTEERRIDKVFTNMKNVQIMEVFKTVENKMQVGSEWLGHRPYLIKVGVHEKITSEFRSTDSKKVIRFSEDWKHISDFEEIYPNDRGGLDKMVKDLLVNSLEIIDKSSVTKLKRVKSGNELALDLMEQFTVDDLKKPIPAKQFYRFMDLFRKGTGESTNQNQPELKEFVTFANGKLSRLNRPNFRILKETCHELWGGRTEEEKIRFDFPNPSVFKKAILSTSNSTAKDANGISLKLAKLIMRSSTGAIQLLYGINKLSALLGCVPDEFKQDIILMLFKNKGTRMLPKYWRPITIAIAYGKMMSKVMLVKYSLADDKHIENHAYAPRKSCMSAIAVVLEAIREIIKISKTMEADGWELIPVMFLEDIQAAFESIPHEVINEFIKLNFSDQTNFKLAEMAMSYLQRSVSIKDSKTGELKKLHQTFPDQSSPQGDTLSPPWWRVTDCCFSKLYTNSLKDLVEFSPEVYSYKHVSFSDDHMTIIALKVRIGISISNVRKLIIDVGNTCRALLNSATLNIGTSVNPTKSEIVVMEKFEDPKIKGKTQELASDTTWLGHSFRLYNDKRLRFTEDRLETRLEKMRREYSKVFLTVDNISTRRLFYQTYIKPVIDWFLPVAMLQNTNNYSKMQALEQFQHRALAAVIGITKNVDRYSLLDICQETKIQTKLHILATQLKPLFRRNSEELSASLEIPIVMTLRSGMARCEQNDRWKSNKNKDFGDRVNHLAEIQEREQFEFKKYGDFDAKKAIIWKRQKIGQIVWRINQRLANL